MSGDGGPRLVLEAGDARAIVLPGDGGRIGSVTVGGSELLITDSALGAVYWGAYPMAPWAGRIRHGRFTFAGAERQLPLGMPPHAIHGVVFDRPWAVEGPETIAVELDQRWPFRGRVRQSFRLDGDGLDVAMTVEADEPMPVSLGWHPWFRRVLAPGEASARLAFDAGAMLLRDAEGIPTGERVPPTEGPWDDAFTDVRYPPMIEWPGRLRLTIASTCAWWVVYTMPVDAICVEPQSGPPDAANLAPETVVPGAPLTHSMRWSWERLG